MTIGETVYAWTVTYAYTGRVVAVNPLEVTLEDVVLVYETGPLPAFLAGGAGTRAEPMPRSVHLNRGAIVGWTER